MHQEILFACIYFSWKLKQNVDKPYISKGFLIPTDVLVCILLFPYDKNKTLNNNSKKDIQN